MLVNVNLDVSWEKGLPLKVAAFIGLLNFEWHSQNEVGNIGLLVLWRVVKTYVAQPSHCNFCSSVVKKGPDTLSRTGGASRGGVSVLSNVCLAT